MAFLKKQLYPSNKYYYNVDNSLTSARRIRHFFLYGMNIGNNSFLISTTESVQSNLNSTIEIYDTSSSSTILTIVILSLLCVSGWVFMSYALFSRSEAYRRKPDDQYGISHHVDNLDSSNQNDFIIDLD